MTQQDYAATEAALRRLEQDVQNENRRARYATDPGYRRARCARTPEALAKCAARRRERSASDPAYRALRNAQAKRT